METLEKEKYETQLYYFPVSEKVKSNLHTKRFIELLFLAFSMIPFSMGFTCFFIKSNEFNMKPIGITIMLCGLAIGYLALRDWE